MNVSQSACTMLSKLLTEAQAPDGVVARIIPSGEGLSLTMDEVQTDDATFDHGGKPVLAIAQNVVEIIDDKTLDVVSTAEGPQLTLVAAGEEGSSSLES